MAAEHWYKPLPPPKDLRNHQTAVLERCAERLGKVAAAVPLNFVELGEELGQGRYAHDRDSSRAGQLLELGNGTAIVVDVLDDVQGEHSIKDARFGR